MQRQKFERLVEEALGELPGEFRAKLENIVVLVEDAPPGSRRSRGGGAGKGRLLLGLFTGVPRTSKSVFEPSPPDRIILYQKNIEAVCATEEEIREQVRLTVLHELGHYFGLSEDQLRHL